MGTMYAWATKEYLLERMSIGQIMMYLHYGIDIKYPKPHQHNAIGSMIGQPASEIRKQRDRLRRQFGENIEGL